MINAVQHNKKLMIWFCSYTDVMYWMKYFIHSAFRVSVKNSTGDSGGIRTHDLLLTSADILTSMTISQPARILQQQYCNIDLWNSCAGWYILPLHI